MQSLDLRHKIDRRAKYSDLNFSSSSLKAILLDVWPLGGTNIDALLLYKAVIVMSYCS